MITLFIGIFLFASIVYTGFVIKRNIVAKKNYYNDIIDFIIYYENEINSYKLRLGNIITAFASRKKSKFSEDLLKFNEKISNGNADVKGCFSHKFLAEEDLNILSDYFMSIGKCDILGELNNIENFKNRFKKTVDEVNKKCNTNSALYMKLSILLGLVVMIIVL